MRRLMQFAKTAVIGGFFFVLPFAIVVFVFAEVVSLVSAILEPLVDQLPVDVLGVEVAVIVAIVAVLTLCFVMGLIIRTRLGTQSTAWVERVVLNRVPGYTVAKSLTQRFSGMDPSSPFVVALAQLHHGDAMVLGFIVEEHEDGMVALFVPASPTPTVGFLYYVKADQVRKLDVPIAAALNCVMQWGVGSKAILQSGAREA